jgi:hypothetical protein
MSQVRRKSGSCLALPATVLRPSNAWKPSWLGSLALLLTTTSFSCECAAGNCFAQVHEGCGNHLFDSADVQIWLLPAAVAGLTMLGSN